MEKSDSKYQEKAIIASYAQTANTCFKSLFSFINRGQEGANCKDLNINLIEEYIPFFSQFFEKEIILNDIEKIKKQLDEISDALDNIRNFYTHFYHDELKSRELYLSLDKIFKKAVHQLQKRYQLSPEDQKIAHLKDCTKYRMCEKENGKGRLTRNGILFFCCLFLPKREGFLFLSQLENFKNSGEKNSTSDSYRMTKEAFVLLRIKSLPKRKKLNVERNTKQALALDIFNELAKCPDDLFRVLSPNDQEKFRVLKEIGEGQEEMCLMKRGRDRFEELCLKVLEQKKETENLFFYSYLGHYYHHQYPKTLINGEKKENRTLRDQLKGLVRWTQEDFSEGWDTNGIPIEEQIMVDEKEEFKPFISKVTPHYIINDNKIGLSFEKQLPTITTQRAHNPIPQYWLSRYDIPDMIYWLFFNTRKNIKIKRVLEGLDPKKELYYNAYPTCIKKRIDRYLEEGNKKLADLKEKQDKQKENSKYTINIGKLAEELARDMIWMQPGDRKLKNHGKVTGANFQALQKSLAVYSESNQKEKLLTVFKGAHLISSSHKHPFLEKVKLGDDLSFIALYRAYYERRSIYLKEQQEKLKKGKVDINFYPFHLLKARQERLNSPHKDIEGRVGIMLPRGIFKKENQKNKYSIESHLKNHRYVVEKGKEDFSQDFYLFARSYEIFNNGKKKKYQSEEERRVEFQEKKEVLKKNKDAFNKMKRIEEKIRFKEKQDRILFLLAKSLWMEVWETFIKEQHLPGNLSNKNKEDLDNVYLKDISYSISKPTESRFFLNQLVPLCFKYASCIEIKGEVKIKNYGRVMALLETKLMPSLLDIIKAKYKETSVKIELSIDYLEKELEAFTNKKQEAILIIQELERWLVDILPDSSKVKQDGGYYNFNSLINGLKMFESFTGDDLIAKIINIRNDFAHDAYSAIDNLEIENYFEKLESESEENILYSSLMLSSLKVYSDRIKEAFI